MGETLRQKGVRSVHQTITTDFAVAKKFIEDFDPQPFRVILKPNMGAGSDDVHLCKNMEEVEKTFNSVNGKLNSLGLKNDGVLVQEYLDGDEYVIDTVSINGKHEITSLWVYDKREVNNRFNVYFGSFPMVNDSDLSQRLINYVYQVLDALDFQNGPAHAEIKMTSTGPCLVEIGARLHGGGGSWLEMARRCWGVDQISSLLKTVDHTDNRDHPDHLVKCSFPTEFNEFGVVIDLVHYDEGVIEEIVGDKILRQLPSFHAVYYYCKVGESLGKTVDCNTTPGQMVLIHESREQVVKDYEFVHELSKQRDGLLKLKRD